MTVKVDLKYLTIYFDVNRKENIPQYQHMNIQDIQLNSTFSLMNYPSFVSKFSNSKKKKKKKSDEEGILFTKTWGTFTHPLHMH